ncbi:MAG: hypothetical protein ACE5I1_10095, partial [bacterium]
MNRFKIIFHALLIAAMAAGLAFAKEKPANEKNKDGLAKIKGVNAYQPERYQLLNINNLWAWHREDGQSNHSPTGDNG